MTSVVKIIITGVIIIISLVFASVSRELTGTSLIGVAVLFGAYAAIKAVWRYGKEEEHESSLPASDVENQELDKS